MILLGLEILIGSYITSKILDKKPKKNICTTSVKKGNHKDITNVVVNDIEKKANHFMKISATAMALSIIGSFYSPLTILNLAIISYITLPIFKEAENSILKERKIGNALLNSLISLVCFSMGLYFVAAMAACYYHVARKVMAKAQGYSQKMLIDVFEQQPSSVWIFKDKIEIEVPLETVQVNDIVIVNTSEVVPVDGIIIDGGAMIDQHTLTGESRPVEKMVDDNVLASTIVIAGKILVKVEKAGTDTTISKMSQMLNSTTNFKSKIQLKGERWADKSAPPLLGLAGLALPILGISGMSAIVSSSPGDRIKLLASYETFYHLNLASHQGILIKDGRALEGLTGIDTILFDKTGTLTSTQAEVGRIVVVKDYSENDILKYAAAAESKLVHPIAKAILKKAQEFLLILPDIDDSQYKIGYGISVSLDDKIIRVGSSRFMEMEGIVLPDKIKHTMRHTHSEGNSLVIVAINNQVGGAIEIRSSVRPEVKQMLRGLRKRGIKHIAIVSGDHKEPTQKLAKELKMDSYFYNVLPENKADIVEKFQNDGKSVMFIGDGINDVLAMKKADVSISLSGATLIATDVAQVILMDGSLSHLCKLLDISKSLDSYLQKALIITFAPAAFILGGAFILHFSVIAATAINSVGLLGGVAYAMFPRKIEREMIFTKKIKELE
jgi:Cu2+-exporting ATPase